MGRSEFFRLLKQTFAAWKKDKASRLAAALSYYTIFSLAPLILLLIAIAGFILGQDSVQNQVISQARGTLGKEGAEFISDLIKNQTEQKKNVIATLVGIGSLLLGAIGIFNHLKTAINEIWHIEESEKKFITKIQDNLLSFGMLLVMGFLLLVSLILTTIITFVGKFFQEIIPVPAFVLEIINLVFSFGIITLLFASMYKMFPDRKVNWKDALIGGMFTSLLFTIGKFFIGMYLSHAASTSQYGAAGALILILLWVYYSAQILFFGVEFTKLYAEKYGSLYVPNNQESLSKKEKIAKSFLQGMVEGLFPKKN